jgi:hypothetical protein
MTFKTFVQGNVLNASEVNTYLMKQAVMTFASATARNAALTTPNEGMIAYLEDVNMFTWYNGTSWFFLNGNTPRAELTKTTDQTIGTASYTTITSWSQTEMISLTQSGGIITIPSGFAGRYNISACASWATNSTGIRALTLAVNGTTTTYPGSMVTATAQNTQLNIAYNGIRLYSGDTLRLLAYQNSGGNLALNASAYAGGFKFLVEYIGA